MIEVIKKSSIWSNIFFIIPLVLSWQYKMYIHAVLIILAIIFSTLYHITDRRSFVFLDKVFAYAVIVYNLILCYASGFREPYFLFALIFVCVGLHYLYREKKTTGSGICVVLLLPCYAYLVLQSNFH